MRNCYKENDGYIICPHTAVGCAYYHQNKKDIPQVHFFWHWRRQTRFLGLKNRWFNKERGNAT